jgi:hypothetical protein
VTTLATRVGTSLTLEAPSCIMDLAVLRRTTIGHRALLPESL